MNDLTLVYYTANREDPGFLRRIREHLVTGPGAGLPLISVTQEPFDFGQNVCVGEIGYSIYNIYVQILAGAKQVKTKYMACCEDDSLYTREHFSYRPNNAFAYNISRGNVTRNTYFHRNRAGMCTCIAPTELMIKTLEIRFAKFPPLPDGSHLLRENLVAFGEPGRYEERRGLPRVNLETFTSNPVPLTFSHRKSVGGSRKILPRDTVMDSLPYWGRAEELWKYYYGE